MKKSEKQIIATTAVFALAIAVFLIYAFTIGGAYITHSNY